MGNVLYWGWVILVVVGTIIAFQGNIDATIPGLIVNSLIYILPVYLFRKYRRRRTISNDG